MAQWSARARQRGVDLKNSIKYSELPARKKKMLQTPQIDKASAAEPIITSKIK